MLPARAKKTRTSTTSTNAIPSLPAPTILPTKQDEDTHTPERSPAKRTAGITQAQKQALVDNLQLEITERARKLRAQYALQTQGLRTRLEMRVNRIPQALRKRNMQDLLDEHAGKAKPAPAPPVPAKDTVIQQTSMAVMRSPERKSLKRQSDHISTSDDKENAPAENPSEDPLPNARKRAKTAITANTKATRTVSRKLVLVPSSVLSPKSHNSRTLPRSSFKPILSPEKAALSRPISPVKPSIQQLAPPAKATARAPSRQAKRPGTAMEEEGRSSEVSTDSAGTTIVTKAAGAKGRPAAAKAVAAVAKTAGVGRKPAAAGKKGDGVAVGVAVGGGRTLRKRG